MNKKQARNKRAVKIRTKIKKLNAIRLTIHKTSQHIYAQIIDSEGKFTLQSASTTQNEIKSTLENTGNIRAAIEVGKRIAQKAISIGITHVAFDRSGFKYHGRVKALADAARDAGLKF